MEHVTGTPRLSQPTPATVRQLDGLCDSFNHILGQMREMETELESTLGRLTGSPVKLPERGQTEAPDPAGSMGRLEHIRSKMQETVDHSIKSLADLRDIV